MPFIEVKMFAGRTDDQKRQFVKAVTEAAVKHLDLKPESIWISIHEFSRNNWAVAGELASERVAPSGENRGPGQS